MRAQIETVRLRITGRVQGVGYRLWAMRTAARLGLRGWVRNRSDGSVEALVTGDPEAVAAMIEACRNGPPGARVAEVAAAPDEDDGSLGFDARPTQ
jgi:acylphosphatase